MALEKVSYYFYINGEQADRETAARTEDLGVRQVNLDWNEAGELIGIEVI